ncbi:hypothetical protein BVRB_2g023900 [Beta vulgaris subsp. vulgaris]|nr:hypothetical protein BVRB_2g023900 [Beta vulgaris subsp. vulgaris]
MIRGIFLQDFTGLFELYIYFYDVAFQEVPRYIVIYNNIGITKSIS